MDEEKVLKRWRRRAEEIDSEAEAVADAAAEAKLRFLAATLRRIADEYEALLPRAAGASPSTSSTRH